MRTLVILFLYLSATIVSAQNNKSLLWEISGKGLKSPSYLYGTMHLTDERVYQFGDSVMVKFDQCDAMAGELILDKENLNDPSAMMALIQKMRMPKDTTLEMLLSKSDYKLVKAKAEEKLGFMAALIDQFKPFFISVMFMQTKVSSDSTEALDMYLQSLAKEKGKKVLGLETAEEQLSAIDKVSLKDQAESLVKSLKEEEKYDIMMSKMMDIYMEQDIDRLDTFMSEYEMTDKMNEYLLVNRNLVMAERMGKIMKEQSTFIAVGAAHLGGKDGLITLLRREGYTVRPIFSNYSGKPSVKTTEAGWYIYEDPSGEYEVHFPYLHNENLDKSITALNKEDNSLYSFTEDSDPGKSADKYFELKQSELKKAGIKITSVKKSKDSIGEVLDITALKGGIYMRSKYYFFNGKGGELSVWGTQNSIKSKTCEDFLKSLILK